MDLAHAIGVIADHEARISALEKNAAPTVDVNINVPPHLDRAPGFRQSTRFATRGHCFGPDGEPWGERIIEINVEKNYVHSVIVGQHFDAVSIACSLVELPVIIASEWFARLSTRRADGRVPMRVTFITETP